MDVIERGDMGKVFFTSDLHIGHRLVAGHRGFDDVEDHDAWLAEKWDSVVNPNGDRGDIVWVLGDISAGGNESQRKALGWFLQRRGTKILIPGNHDGCHPSSRSADNWEDAYRGVFKRIPAFQRRRIFGHTVLLSHFPYAGDGDREPGVERYAQYRLPDHGDWLLHGHTHLKEKIGGRSGKSIHVGVDAWDGELIPIETIGEMLNAGPAT